MAFLHLPFNDAKAPQLARASARRFPRISPDAALMILFESFYARRSLLLASSR